MRDIEVQIGHSGKHFPEVRKKMGHFALVALAPIDGYCPEAFRHYQMGVPIFNFLDGYRIAPFSRQIASHNGQTFYWRGEPGHSHVGRRNQAQGKP
jgi:hypothetical protein